MKKNIVFIFSTIIVLVSVVMLKATAVISDDCPKTDATAIIYQDCVNKAPNGSPQIWKCEAVTYEHPIKYCKSWNVN